MKVAFSLSSRKQCQESLRAGFYLPGTLTILLAGEAEPIQFVLEPLTCRRSVT